MAVVPARICGLNDRPRGSGPDYGTIRSMTYDGCRRKFDVAAY